MNLKKILAGVLACCIIGGTLPAGVRTADVAVIKASAADEFTIGEYESLKYKNCGDHIEITGCDKSATSVDIPAEIDGLPVTSIGIFAFNYCEGLTEITMPDSVTSIGEYAFENCSELTEITIPDSVTSIGDSAFESTPWLETRQKENPLVIINGILIDGTTCSGKVVIPDSVTRIGDFAFNSGLTDVTIPDSVISIEVTIPDSVISIGVYAFRRAKLTEITIPESVTSIEYGAFGCEELTKITILNPNCEIDDDIDTISNNHDAGGIYFSGTIYGYENSTAQAYAKKYNRTFESLGEAPEDPADVLKYENHGDYIEITGCDKSATSVDIPAEIDGLPVMYIERGIFNYCTELTEINVSENNQYYTDIDGVLFNKDKTELHSYPNGKSGAYTIPDGVTVIRISAFEGSKGLTSVTLPNGVINIGPSAFKNCSELTSVNIPDSVTGLGVAPDSLRSAGRIEFAGCTKLAEINVSENNPNYTDIDGVLFNKDKTELLIYPDGKSEPEYTIPDGVTSFKWVAFGDFTGLTSVTIPDSVTNINFSIERRGLTEINVSENNKKYADIDGVLFNKDKTTLLAYPAEKDYTEYTIPDGVTSIGYSAFYGYTELTEITIPDSITSIGNSAFGKCTELTEITILNPDCTIGDYASTISDTATIYGYENSTAQEYAEKYGRNFKLLGEAPEDPADVLKYENHGDYIEITGCDKSATSVDIPAEIDGLPVTSIGKGAFSSCTGLTEINIPDSVTSIGQNAFYSCTGLTEITIPDSVTSIGNWAFFDTPWLESKRAENPLVVINKIIIDGITCSGDVVIPDGVTSIPDMAFSWCEEMTSITIPNSVTSIGVSAFEYCSGLTSINIPNSVTSIGSSAFDNCTGLTSITIPDSVTSIADRTFVFCSELKEVNIPDSVTSIDEYAFYYCGKLTGLTIPDSVTSIGFGAFVRCLELKKVTIPDSVTSIGQGAFSECSALTEFTILNPDCEIYDYILLHSNNATLYGYDDSTAQAYAERENIKFESLGKAPEAPADVLQYIKYDDHIEITGCDTSATEVVIPAEIDGVPVTTIGDNAFNGCKALTGITIPDSVTSIGSSAFYDCTKLTEIIIPESAAYIGADAFKGCSSLKNITIPDSLTEFSAGVFADTLWLKSRQEEDPLVVVNGTLIDGTACSGEVVVPESVRKIGYCAFSDCTELTGITLPESVQSIGDFAFDRCTGLTRITILNPECSISYYDVGVSGDTIPENATVYGYDNSTAYEFAKEYNRKFVSLGKAPVDAVAYENHGDYIEITNCDKSATSVVIPAEINGVPVTSIGERAFNGCTGLTSITIPDSVTSIGEWAFLDCTELTDITIPDSVTSIGTGAFGNTGLTEVTIPDSVTSISKEAFSFCSGLKTITILNPECKIADIESVIYNSYDEDSSTFVYSGVIKGYSGSTAEAYANKYNMTFEAIEIIEPTFLLGDVNMNGIIDGSDATDTLYAYTRVGSNLDTGLTDEQFKAADIDGDGNITGSDATYILRYYTELSSLTGDATLPPMEEWIKNS